MKKRSSSRQNSKPAMKAKRAQQSVTIGMDLGDKTSRYCLLSDEGEILREGQVATTKVGMTGTFGRIGRARIAIEVGTHSPWVSRLLRSFGHELIVANPRQVKLITESSRKDDRLLDFAAHPVLGVVQSAVSARLKYRRHAAGKFRHNRMHPPRRKC